MRSSSKPKQPGGKRWQRWLQARWMVDYVPFALFLALLAVLYIANGHHADKTVREMAAVRQELKQLQYEYKTLKAELMYRSKESELARAVAPIGLRRLTEPPWKIEADTIPPSPPAN